MYYDSKSAFYVRQYGPAIIITVLSVALIGGGIYIYLKSQHIIDKPAQNIVANVDTQSESETQNAMEPVVSQSIISDELNTLNSFEKSKVYKVGSVTDDGAIIIEDGSAKANIYLIGVDFSNSSHSAIQKIRDDLSSKDVQIAFDTEKIENSKMYAYIYKDNDLYNGTILKSGLVKLRVERKNINLLDILLKAQLEAKNANIGIWR